MRNLPKSSLAILIVGVVISTGIGLVFYITTELQPAIATFAGLLGTILTLQIESAVRFARLRAIETKVDDIAGSMEYPDKEMRTAIKKKFDSDLLRLFPRHFEGLLDLLMDNIGGSNATLTRKEDFPTFYASTLEAFPRSTFLATGFSDDGFLWSSSRWEEAIQELHSGGGKIVRVFFIDQERMEDIEPDVRAALTRQTNFGAEIYVVPEATVRNHHSDLYEMMLVDTEGRIMWKYDLKGRTIARVLVTTDKDTIQRHIRTFNSLKELKETRRFEIDSE